MKPICRRPSFCRHPFLYFCLLLTVLLLGAGALTARAQLDARRVSARPAEMGRITRAKSIAVGLASAIMKDGRDFAGTYEEVNAADLGETYYVSVKFQIFNYSEANVSGATVCLLDRFTNESRWSVAGVSVEDRRSVVLAGELTIPRNEYEYWQKGGTPYLFIKYRNAQDVDQQRTIELARMPIGEVQ